MKQTVVGSTLFGVAAATLLAQSGFGQPGGWRRFQDAPQQSAGAQAAPAPAPSYSTLPAVPAPPQITVPAGTWISIRVNEPLSSDHNHQGDTFTATLAQPLVAQGFVVARRGEIVAGRVAEALKAGRVKGTSQLSIELGELTLVDGQHVPLRTELIQYAGGTSVGRDATAIGTTTGLGAAIGAAADGGFGAGMGAIAGAGASIIGVLVTRGRPTVIGPEDTLTFKTTTPITVSTESAPHAFQPVRQEDYEPQKSLQRRHIYAAAPPYYGPGPYWGPGWGPYWGGPGFYGGSVVIIGHGGRGRRW